MISSETIHPSGDIAEFTFDFGLEAANTSLEFSSEVTNHSLDFDFHNSPTTNHLGALISSQEIQEDPLALNQNHQFSDLMAAQSGLKQPITISSIDLTAL